MRLSLLDLELRFGLRFRLRLSYVKLVIFGQHLLRL